jgi:glycosyltransferase involved in cell wall biosynthesis
VLGAAPGDTGRLIERSNAGIAVPPADAAALAAAVRRLHALEPHERAAMGERGRAFYLEHLSERVGSATLAGLLQGAVNTPPPREFLNR